MYRASTEEEQALDKSLNIKLDFLVVGLCAANFLVSELPGRVFCAQHVLTSWIDARTGQVECWKRCNILVP